MKKILFLINTLNCGGAEKVLIDTVNAMSTDEWEITVQTVLGESSLRGNFKNKINYKYIISTKNKLLSRILMSLFIKIIPAKLIYNLFVKNDYDYEVAYLEGFPTKILSMSSNKKTKKVAWIHTNLITHPDSYRAYGSEAIEKDAYSKFDSIACVSDGVKESFIKKYGYKEKVKTIYNVIDDDTIKTNSKVECDFDFSKTTFITIGRLIPQKGYYELLDVLKKLNDDKFDYQMLIIGEGNERKRLEEKIKKYNLTNVHLLGEKSNPHNYLVNGDLFISSSFAEGFSTVITEAVILEVPVISTNTAGAKEPQLCPRSDIVVENHKELYFELKKILTDLSILDDLKVKSKNKSYYFRKEYLASELNKYLNDI